MTVLEHIGQCLLFLLILAGPVPLALACAALADAGEGSPHRRSASLFVAVLTWCLLQMLGGLLLGMFHCLTPGAVYFAEVLYLAAGGVAWRRLNRPVASVSVPALFQSEKPCGPLDGLMILSLVCLGLRLAWTVFSVPIVEYDSLGYHLPTLARWYQRGRFEMLEQFYYPELPSTYPYGWHILGALCIMPFRGDLAVAFPNLIAWAMLGLAVYRAGIELGATRAKGLAAAALVQCIPLVVEHVNEMHVDLALAAFFMSGLSLAVSFSRRRSPVHLALFLATLGALAGTRTSGLAYGAVLAAAWAVLAVGRRSAEDRPAMSVGSSPAAAVGGRFPRSALPAVGAGIMLLLGGFWYVRNWAMLGNPLGYLQVAVGGHVIIPGPYGVADFGRTTLAGLFHFNDARHWEILIGQVWQRLGFPFLALLVPCMALPAGWALSRGRKLPTRAFAGLAALLAVTGFLYWTTPFSADNGSFGFTLTPWMGGQMRFAFPMVAVLAVLAAAAATMLRARDEIAAVVALAAAALALDKPRAAYVGGAIILAWGLYGILRSGRVAARLDLRIAGQTWLMAAAIVVFLGGTFAARQRREQLRGIFYGQVVRYLDKLVRADEPIGYLASRRSYVLYGRRLDRHVHYVPAGSDNSADWIQMLRERGISLIAVGPLIEPDKSRLELEWLRDPAGPFVCVLPGRTETDPTLYRLTAAP